ncbi:MAG: ABC transporter ATP-binding protein [Prevotella sp.]|nr:ABC transporter ATP-binding protein [Prevotella sp.]
MNGLNLEKLTIGYRSGRAKMKIVAADLSTKLESGRLTCLLGRNGSGKSTLLRTLADLQEPLGGQIFPKTQGKCAVVLTERLDLRNFSAAEVVGLGRTPHTNFWGTLRREDRAIVAEAMKLVGIDPLANADFATLSDGERQKVLIAKALAQQTPLIVLDEPTAFLDFPSKREIFNLLRHLAHEQGKTILLSTHDIALAAEFADEIWFLDGGKLRTGSVGELPPETLFQ